MIGFRIENILSGVAAQKGFIDCVVSSFDRTIYPAKGIGGFAITQANGNTYHYSLPAYRNYQGEYIAVKGSEQTKYSRSSDQNKTAITWLLTAITGPDFVDRGQAGIVDDADWGYWVKFDYGQTSSNFSYRSPYYGYINDGQNDSYSCGTREEYYLNSIQTRTHIGLFIKGYRTDGLSSYYNYNDPTQAAPSEIADGTTNQATPPMSLDEIILMQKTDFANLTTMGFQKFYQTPAEYPGNYFFLGNVYDVNDISQNASFRPFINSRALKRVKFRYDLSLCPQTSNSFATPNSPPPLDTQDTFMGKQGKLTLQRVQFFGINSTNLFPDYKFGYSSNPSYNKYAWDGWGYYNSLGGSIDASHVASSNDADAYAWCLTNITLPSGGKIQVDYESDSYASISGRNPLGSKQYQFSYSPSTIPSTGNSLTVSNLDGGLVKGDSVYLNGKLTCNDIFIAPVTILGKFVVNAIAGNTVTLSASFSLPGGCSYSPISFSGYLNKIGGTKRGGDSRVSTITVSDSFGYLSKSNYSYVNADNTCSGVVAKEPEFIKDSSYNPDNFGLDRFYDYPYTPVLYSRVVVKTGYDNSNGSYANQTAYEFETPSTSLIAETNNQVKDYLMPGYKYFENDYMLCPSQTVYFKQYFNRVDIRTAHIGKLKSINIYDQNSNLIGSTTLTYKENTTNDQGRYTSGSLISEFTSLNGVQDPYVMRLMRTVKTTYPYALTQVTSSKDGFSQTTNYNTWDFYTGAPLITDRRSSLGKTIRTELIPAYTIYPGMGLKSANSANSNMVEAAGATYQYTMDNFGTITGVVSGTVNLWSNSWTNYRYLNGTTYADVAEGPNIWRKSGSYTYYGTVSDLKTDGSGALIFDVSKKFNYASLGSNTLWKQVSAINRFNHFSVPLEVSNMSGIKSSIKLDINNRFILASCSNAGYFEFAYSGAEDGNSSTIFFGGEVALNSSGSSASTVVTGTAGVTTHTGQAAVQVTQGNNSFIYKSATLTSGRTYRAQVWTNSPNGAIYYNINSASSPTKIMPVSVNKVGNWYKILADITIPSTFIALEIGVTSTSGTVLFDDFRFQPRDASLQTNVYDASTGYLTYTLGNDNLYTRYQYDDRGIVMKTFVESIKYNGERLVTGRKDNLRRLNTDQ